MIFNNEKSLLTKNVLKCISFHLSSRKDCKDIEYIITISKSCQDTDVIKMSPYITVFPDIHNRKNSDKRGVAYHVIFNHFPEIFIDANFAIVRIQKHSLVYGTYIYKKFKFTNRRKWRKIEENEYESI